MSPQATAMIEAGWKPQGALQGCVLVLGNEGEAYYEGTLTRGETARFPLLKDNQVMRDETRSPTSDYMESFYLFQRACVEAMQGGIPVLQTGAENLKTLVATYAGYQAAAQGEIVNFAESFCARHDNEYQR